MQPPSDRYWQLIYPNVSWKPKDSFTVEELAMKPPLKLPAPVVGQALNGYATNRSTLTYVASPKEAKSSIAILFVVDSFTSGFMASFTGGFEGNFTGGFMG
jgi:hypothetical protein